MLNNQKHVVKHKKSDIIGKKKTRYLQRPKEKETSSVGVQLVRDISNHIKRELKAIRCLLRGTNGFLISTKLN